MFWCAMSLASPFRHVRASWLSLFRWVDSTPTLSVRFRRCLKHSPHPVRQFQAFSMASKEQNGAGCPIHRHGRPLRPLTPALLAADRTRCDPSAWKRRPAASHPRRRSLPSEACVRSFHHRRAYDTSVPARFAPFEQTRIFPPTTRDLYRRSNHFGHWSRTLAASHALLSRATGDRIVPSAQHVPCDGATTRSAFSPTCSVRHRLVVASHRRPVRSLAAGRPN